MSLCRCPVVIDHPIDGDEYECPYCNAGIVVEGNNATHVEVPEVNCPLSGDVIYLPGAGDDEQFECPDCQATITVFNGEPVHAEVRICPVKNELTDYGKTGKSIYDVDLKAPPQERWKPVVCKLGDELHELLADVIEIANEHVTAWPIWTQPFVKAAIGGAVGLGGQLVRMIAGMFDQEYLAEISGMAKAAGVPSSQLLLANLMYDLSQVQSCHFGACSSYSCNVNGLPTLARNMDWCWPDTVGQHTILVRYHRGKESYLSIGIVGSVGILSAIYSGHWAVTLNQAPVQKLNVNPLQWPALQRLRAACDRFGTFVSLSRRVTEYQTMSPFFAHIVGVKPTEHLVVEHFGTEFDLRLKHGEFLLQTNHFSSAYEDYNPTRDEFYREWANVLLGHLSTLRCIESPTN